MNSPGSLVLSTMLGIVWALMRVSGVIPLAMASRWAVNVIRGIPILVQLFYIYFVLPDYGVTLSTVQAAIIGLGIAYSAYQAEVSAQPGASTDCPDKVIWTA